MPSQELPETRRPRNWRGHQLPTGRDPFWCRHCERDRLEVGCFPEWEGRL